MVTGNNAAGTRKHKTIFICQKTYFSPLTGAGGNKYNLLMEKPLGFGDESDPAAVANVDTTVALTLAGARPVGASIDIVWVYPAQDIKRILNQAVCTISVDVGAGVTFDDASVTVGKYNVATGAFTASGSETWQTQPAAGASGIEAVGATSRKYKILINDMTPMAIAIGERPAFRTRVWARDTVGGVHGPITLNHQRGRLDTYLVVDSLKEDV